MRNRLNVATAKRRFPYPGLAWSNFWRLRGLGSGTVPFAVALPGAGLGQPWVRGLSFDLRGVSPLRAHRP